ncbi:hypothetical protein [Corynebacterium lubricantis]|uniref:hypothetical protein n=1 Tax=Corynebacterium lubricantis TaxID=541095 RepID=UPI00035D1DA8|nr:hypothetical protein [Corynebacterium lubricantis]
MFPDELRSTSELHQQKIAYAFRDPELAYKELNELRNQNRFAGNSQKLDSIDTQDLKRRLNESFFALKDERQKVSALTSELEETRSKLVLLRNSRTMKAGQLLSRPFNLIKKTWMRIGFKH